MTREIKIGGRTVGSAAEPFIIAEMSGNHGGSLDRALAIVEAVAGAGAHALKLQTYTADTMTLPIRSGEFVITDPNSLWSGRSLYDLYEEAHTPWEWHEVIFTHARKLGMIAFSSPFDSTAVEFLESLNVPCYKIASFENIDLPLIRRAASTGKPLIISTGMASFAEIDEAVKAARDGGCDQIMLLKCTSSYPAPPEESNLLTIPHMSDLFGCPVGLSDHTLGLGAAIAAVALGAVAIEKHVTLHRSDGDIDSAFSLEPDEVSVLLRESGVAWRARGGVYYGPTNRERNSLIHRRTLYIVRDVEAGARIGPDDVRAIRPGLGLSPKFRDLVIGRRTACALRCGTPVSWDLFS